MAGSLSAASSAAPIRGRSGASCSSFRGIHHGSVAFRISVKRKLRLFASKGSQYNGKDFVLPRAQQNEATVDGSSTAASLTPVKSEAAGEEKKDWNSASSPPVSDASISEFMTQVSNLVKLVDSRDIVELQLKQNDCELIIRKKEALPQPPASAPVVMMQSPTPLPPQYASPPPSGSLAPAPPSPKPATPAATPTAKAPTFSHPPLKCPMAGTFYRSPGPGEPPFVKVGDQVKKGQVVCIVEAMKLMNEIEADQSGKIVDILVEDGKSVSVDMPLFVIEP